MKNIVPIKHSLIYSLNKFNPLLVKALQGMSVCGQFSIVPRYKLEPIIFQFF